MILALRTALIRPCSLASVIAYITAALDVDRTTMAPQSALADRRTNPVTPFGIHWLARFHAHKHNVLDKYPNIPSTIHNGEIIEVPRIEHTFISPTAHYSALFYKTSFRHGTWAPPHRLLLLSGPESAICFTHTLDTVYCTTSSTRKALS